MPIASNDVSVGEHLHAYHGFSESTNQESLLKQYKEYQQLVARLNCELDRELTRYLTRIKGTTASARAALRPSSRASAASRAKERRTHRP